jgi:hypothetical protein
MVKLILLVALVLAVYISYIYYKHLPQEKKRPALIKFVTYAVCITLLILVATGKISWLGAIAAAALAILKFGIGAALRFAPIAKLFRKELSKNPPKFRSEHLDLEFDLDTLEFRGKIIKGPYAGKTLAQLSDNEINELISNYKINDKRSYYILLTARSRLAGAEPEENSANNTNVASGEITLDEARKLLGLTEEYTKKDIEYRYKRLMQKVHPDRGGNDYLASRVNLAREILLKDLNT